MIIIVEAQHSFQGQLHCFDTNVDEFSFLKCPRNATEVNQLSFQGLEIDYDVQSHHVRELVVSFESNAVD